MKFQRYCHESAIDFQYPECRHFGKDGIHGYVMEEKLVYLSVSGMQEIFCEFSNNDNTPLSNDFLIEWAKNASAFIKETIGIAINPLLSMEVPSLIRNLKQHADGEAFNANSPSLSKVQSFPVVSLERDGNSYFLIVDGEPINDRGITNERLANDIFDKLSSDIRLYIKKRWPIE